MFLKDKLSGCNFLVDTGAEASVIPATKEEKISRIKEQSLIAANGTYIPTFGKRIFHLNLVIIHTHGHLWLPQFTVHY